VTHFLKKEIASQGGIILRTAKQEVMELLMVKTILISTKHFTKTPYQNWSTATEGIKY
jgi:hypothetical protein